MTDLFTERDKKKAKAFVKGANTGIAQVLGFPVDMINYAPVLLNLLPGKQGMKPFSDDPLGGAQTFKDLMAAGNVGTYKDIASIPKDEYEAGILGMLSSEALTSLIPISQLVKGLPRGSKTVLPQQTATGVDLSRRDLLKKAGAAAIATAVSPSIIKEVGDVLPSGAATKAVKAGAKTGLPLAVSLSDKLKNIMRAKDSALEITDFNKSMDETFKLNKEANEVTEQLNAALEKAVKGKTYKDFIKMPEEDLLAYGRMQNQIVHMFRKKDGTFVKSFDPLQKPRVQSGLVRALKERGMYEKLGKEYAEELATKISAGRRKQPMGLSLDESLQKDFPMTLPKMVPSGQETKSIFAPEAKKGRQLLIVSCSNNKCPDVGNMKALDRYTGQLFTKMKAEGIPPNVDIAILSAKHGLIRSDTEIEKYDQLMTPEIRDKFISDPEQMKKIRDTMAGDYDKVFVTGGKNYRDVIDAAASGLNYEVIKKKAPGLTQQAVTDKLKEAKGIKVNRAKPTDLAFHYSSYTDDQIKNFDIKKIEQRQLGSYETAGEAKMDSDGIADTTFESILGLHVGTPKAAHDRALRTNYVGFFTKQSEKVRYELPDDEFIKNEDMIPMGSYYSLDIDTSKPYTNPKDELGIWSEGDLEDHIIKILDKDPVVADLLEKQKKATGDEFFSILEKRQQAEMKAFRKFRKSLAEQGFTNVPYYNRMEDPGSISQIMLIDRPKGKDKVIKSKLTSEPMAKGGVAGLSDIARDMFKGPKGIGAYQPFMVG